MNNIKKTFAKCKAEGRPALVTYVTAGYRTKDETPEIMLGMEAGGADAIELGMPFTDPIADGPTIQQSNVVALKNGINLPDILDMVRTARLRGLRAPVLLMGYYNPVLAYGEERLFKEAKDAGIDLTKLVTHRYKGFGDAPKAFDMAGRTKDDSGNLVLKVIIDNAM